MKKKKKTFPLSFSPSLASLYLFEQWLRLGVTSTSSVWLPLQDESLYVFPNCKSLWIKASAKWLNVNVNVNDAVIVSLLVMLAHACVQSLSGQLVYLKGSYDAISSFPLSLECYKLCIDKIPEVAKTKVSKPKRYSLSKLRLCHAPLKQAHSNMPPHVYVTMWKYLRNADQMFTQRKKAWFQ